MEDMQVEKAELPSKRSQERNIAFNLDNPKLAFRAGRVNTKIMLTVGKSCSLNLYKIACR